MNLWPVVAAVAAVLLFTLVSASPVLQLSFPGTYRPIQRHHHRQMRLNAFKIRNQAPHRDYPLKEAKPQDVKLVNYRNKLYHGPITVGTPGQQFSVTFDTATQTSWLPSVHSPPDKRAAHNPRRYNNATSSTYKANGGFTVKNQVFGEAILEPARFADDPINDGVIGLGLSKSARKGHRTVFDNMVSQGLLPAPVFSFYMNRDNTDDRDSVLTLGGTNSEYYTGEFTFADLITPHSWNFWVDGVQISNRYGIYSKRRCQAVVDSANACIVGPKDLTDALNKMLGGVTLPVLPKNVSSL
ncbi:cathepsin d [Plakobranchus ocellatus]|uniref:Cathepsin d n=1 Tax=Plakobranchus ocellatus TaxID=259542 RepID=A0AAV3ZZU7_9GAST|nr:cathepsin d [Plakobranchus ocellatus]